MDNEEKIAVWQRWKPNANVRIIYILDGDQTGRPTGEKLAKWRRSAQRPKGTFAYVNPSELFIEVTSFSRNKDERSREKRKESRRRRGRRSFSDLVVGKFPENSDIDTRELGSSELLHFRVPTGAQMIDMAMCFVAGWLSRHCDPLSDFRIVSNDKHATRVRDFLSRMGFRSQIVPP